MYQRFTQYFQRSLNETQHLEPVIEELWMHCQQRVPAGNLGQPFIRFQCQDTSPFAWSLTIVMADRPFIVETILATLQHFKLDYHTLLHPVVNLQRDAAGQIITVATPHEKTTNFTAESINYISGSHCLHQATEIQETFTKTLAFLTAAVDDWQPIIQRLDDLIQTPRTLPLDTETRAFLEWVREDHFTFMGYGQQTIGTTTLEHPLGFLQHQPAIVVINTTATKKVLRIHKSTKVSLIRRLEPMDVMIIADPLLPDVYHHFYGLWTTYTLQKSPRQIPVLRKKIEEASTKAQLVPSAYLYKKFLKVIEAWPRDVLFETYTHDLLAFVRPFIEHTAPQTLKVYFYPLHDSRLIACLIFIRAPFFQAGLVPKIVQQVLTLTMMDSLQQEVDWTSFGYARLYLLLQANTPICISSDTLESHLKEWIVPWDERLRQQLYQRPALDITYPHFDHTVFPEHYQKAFTPVQALDDIAYLYQALEESASQFRLINPVETNGTYRIMMYHRDAPIPLSDIIPILENIHFYVLTENAVPVIVHDRTVWIHWIDARFRDNFQCILTTEQQQSLVHLLQAVSQNSIVNEPINRLVVTAQLSVRERQLMRCVCGYVRQYLATHSQVYLQDTLLRHPSLVQWWIQAFHAKFDPAFIGDRTAIYADHMRSAQQLISQIYQRDEEEIWLTLCEVLDLMVRTNFYQVNEAQQPKSWISFKISHLQPDTQPADQIHYEIFVSHRTLQAIHLRGGKIARGGIRWSDRREDFRREVMDLVTAQMLKNSIIVPTGSKGGFVLRDVVADETHDAWVARGQAGYQIMVEGMLDLTDNHQHGEIVAPLQTICYDDPDPYLVVAADKGTATFSDTANQIALRRGFWLGDAFASGGSQGYDHKKLGITSKGAWESAKRHAHHLGINPEQDTIRVIAIGDMSGDVFGNGMLQSKTMHLVAAFNHKHIFIDPNPDAAVSFQERQRLFALPRSQWSDYDATALSPGGGIFERSAREIVLSAEMQQLLRVMHRTMEPNALIRTLLKAPVDLIWFGGIGTFIKARSEAEEDVADKANKLLRVDGEDVRAKIIVEGANLGVSHAGRIAFARRGGYINTDTIDNSGGVDCSDHEVNIKILCQELVQQGKLNTVDRNVLLTEMTPAVVDLVLKDNFQQNQQLSIAQLDSQQQTEQYLDLLKTLKEAKRIARSQSRWPSERFIQENGILRPDLCILMATTKMWLKEILLTHLDKKLPILKTVVRQYFPKLLQERFGDAIDQHPLHHEIAVTIVANECINRMGLCFVNMPAKTDNQLLLRRVLKYLDARTALFLDSQYATLDQASLQRPFAETFAAHQVLKNKVIAYISTQD